MDFVQLATAAVSLLTPFMPYLVPLGKELKETVAEVIQKQGGAMVWQKAEEIWQKISVYFGNEEEFQDATRMLSRAPQDPTRQDMFVKLLAEHLQNNNALGEEIKKVLGGPSGVQRIIAGNDAQISRVRQAMAGTGEQIIEAGDRAVFTDLSQEQGFGTK
jgi:hypothetical protein